MNRCFVRFHSLKTRAALNRKFDKVHISVKGNKYNDDYNCMMNRGVSTPLDVAEKISLRKAQSAVLAIVRPKEESLEEGDDFLFSEEYREMPVAVDVNQPLEYSCNLDILSFKNASCQELNYYDEVSKAYWRTCTFLLGHAMKSAFSENFGNLNAVESLDLSVESGSFGVRIAFENDVSSWSPSEIDLQKLTRHCRNILNSSITLDLVGENAYSFGGTEASFDGPLIQSLSQIGNFAVTSITRTENGYFEIIGTSLPAEFGTNHVVFGILEQKSKSLAEKNFEIRRKLPEKTLANLAKDETLLYKQWTGSYQTSDNVEIELTQNQDVEKKALSNIIKSAAPEPNHELNKQYREFEVGRKFLRTRQALNVATAYKLRSIFKNGKFENSVYSDETKQ